MYLPEGHFRQGEKIGRYIMEDDGDGLDGDNEQKKMKRERSTFSQNKGI